MSADNRKQNIEAIIKYCYKERQVEDVAKHIKLTTTSARKYCKIMLDYGVLGYNTKQVGKYNKKTRLLYTLKPDIDETDILVLCQKVREYNRQTHDKCMNKKNGIIDVSEHPINPFSRVITERHPYSEKKKSPRVYVGCSFGQVGW